VKKKRKGEHTCEGLGKILSGVKFPYGPCSRTQRRSYYGIRLKIDEQLTSTASLWRWSDAIRDPDGYRKNGGVTLGGWVLKNRREESNIVGWGRSCREKRLSCKKPLEGRDGDRLERRLWESFLTPKKTKDIKRGGKASKKGD